MNLLDQLNVPGWRLLLFTVDGELPALEPPEGLTIVRREAWIVAGTQYVYEAGGSVRLGEWEYDPDDAHGVDRSLPKADAPIHVLADLLPIARKHRDLGHDVHPVLLEAL